MKNLKKVLSLALAMVMAMSLMTTAFAADYADIDDVTYTEAVEVMTAVGVFNGVGGDKFAPDATLDRASAAKLIAYLDLGAEDADALTATGTVFTDVPADYWAAGYIEYMAAAGYTNGTGNDKFSPKATVTGLEFGKWLLTVLGYNAQVEQMTGASWGINTSKLANSIDLFDGVSEKAAANLTREAAAAYCLNALQATCVDYETLGTDIKMSDGTTIKVGASKAEPVNDKPALDDLFGAGNGFLQLTEKLFEDDLQLTTTPDAFGRPATNWTYGEFKGTYAASDVATYNNKIENKTIYSLLGKNVVDNMKYYDDPTIDTTDYYVTLYVNGVKNDGNNDYYQVKNNTAKVAYANYGSITEVYKDGKYINIVVTETFVGQATADYNANTEKISTNLGFIKQQTDKQDGFEVSGLVEDDYFLYSVAGANTLANIKNVVKAELMTGVVDSYIAGESVVVDGETYYYSKNFVKFGTDGYDKTATYKLGETATFVMDGVGNIIAIDSLTEAADTTYVYVESIGAMTTGRNTTLVGNIVNVDGTTADDVHITYVNGHKMNTTALVDTTKNYENGWYAYTKDGDALKITGDNAKMYYAIASNGAKLVETGKVAIGADLADDLYKPTKANSATVFVIKDADDKITTYTGIANVPTITSLTGQEAFAYFVNNSAGFAKYVYIDLANVAESDAATSTSSDVFYVLGQSGKKVVAGAKADETIEYYTLDVLKDGKIVNVDVIDDSNVTNGNALNKIFAKVQSNADGYVTGATEVTSGTQVKTFAGKADSLTDYYVSYSNNVLTLKDEANALYEDIVVADDVVIYVILTNHNALMEDDQADYEVLVGNASQVAGMLNGYAANLAYTAFGVSEDDKTVTTMYLTIGTVTEI